MSQAIPESRSVRWWREWRGFALFIAVMLVFRSAIADWNQVPSGSMKPSILVGDRIVVDKLAYDLRVPFTLRRIAHWSEPARGDVVTFPSPADERLFVKRIVGVPGDVVELRDNVLIVNGEEARYERLSTTEVEALALEGAQSYEFFREHVAGTTHLVMLSRQSRPTHYRSFGPVEVPAGQFLMLGDNRDDSGDFRVIGWVSRERILGRAEAIAFSLDYDNHYAPRLDRFFASLP
jgi:signal peptidase I